VGDPRRAPGQQSLDPAAVCTLPPSGLADRLAWIEREILPHATRTVRLDRGLAIELDAAPDLAARLDRLIDLERECCSDIVFERHAGATSGALRLEIHGVDPDAAAFRALQLPGASMPVGARFAAAAGAGAIGSVFVCCVLPIAAAALVGAAAAPLASLDGPGPIVAGAVVGGAAAWRWLGRRGSHGKAAASARSCGESC
jgi:hypothetical protein